MFAALVEYKKKRNHCLVAPYEGNERLVHWVRTQRARRRQGKLNAERIRRLDELGFFWNASKECSAILSREHWERWFAALAKYKKKHGHCLVSTLDKKYGGLGCWVRTQRCKRRKGELDEEKIQQLDKLSFVWDASEEVHRRRWEKNFAALVAYKKAHGDCNAAGNLPLAHWIARQRKSYYNGTLLAERVDRLTAIGIRW